MRRVARRMQVTGVSGLNAYYRHLIGNADEVNELFSDLLISVTMFFRDHQAFSALAEVAIKPIFDRLVDDAPIRVWVVGCATGEEAYSIGMLLLEEADRRGVHPAINIFASDLDETALAVGREGRYPRTIEADMSEERLRRFFVPDGQSYRVRKELRDLVLFASHSALRDPPFIRLDLITCRNLLIYLQRDLQRELCTLFHYALKPAGFLFLGSAETIDATPGLYVAVDREARIYAARAQQPASAPMLPQLAADHRYLQMEPKPVRAAEASPGPAHLHAAALEDDAPPSVLIDAAGRILHLSPTASRFFLPSEGEFVTDLTAQVRPELRVDLKLALQQAAESGEPSSSPHVPIPVNGGHRLVGLHVRPRRPPTGGVITEFLVFFLDGGRFEMTPEPMPATGVTQHEVRRLRQELSIAQERLSASQHKHDVATQELRAANEELQSVNEEYRSTAEELETSKEELQSMNEELQTVNAELKSKLETISFAHNDLQNLMASTEIGTLFLDPDMRIKLFTPPVANHFNITASDIGRALSDFTNRLAYDDLENDARGVMRTLQPSEAEVTTRDGHWLAVHMRPYRTVEGRIEGVVVTFADMTARKLAEQALADELRAMTRLQQFSMMVVATDDLQSPLGTILETSIELLGAACGAIHLYDADTKTLRMTVHRGLDAAFVDTWSDVRSDTPSSCGKALASGQQVLIEDIQADPNNTGPLAAARVRLGLRAVQSTPLLASGGKVVGMLTTHFRTTRPFTERDLRLITICSRQAADVINAFQLQQSLRDSEARMRKVLETEAVGILFFNNAGVLVDCNDAFLHMSGYQRSQVESHALSWQQMTPSTGSLADDEQMQALERTGRFGPYEREYLRQDGSRRWILFAGRRIEKDLIAEYAIDVSDRKKVEQERELLSRELSHRVKNTLAVVQALANQTKGETIQEFRQVLNGRLGALAEVHGLLLQSNWQDADIRLLVQQALAAYRSPGRDRVKIDGSALLLKPNQALGLSLVLHELATNAVKYGALSTDTGQVHVTWAAEAAADGRQQMRMRWAESGGPIVEVPQKSGFGTQLIVRICEYDLEGHASLTYRPEGLLCEFTIPMG